jgi:hypothetical protein
VKKRSFHIQTRLSLMAPMITTLQGERLDSFRSRAFYFRFRNSSTALSQRFRCALTVFPSRSLKYLYSTVPLGQCILGIPPVDNQLLCVRASSIGEIVLTKNHIATNRQMRDASLAVSFITLINTYWTGVVAARRLTSFARFFESVHLLICDFISHHVRTQKS